LSFYFLKIITGINKKHIFGIFTAFFKNHNAGRNTCPVENIGSMLNSVGNRPFRNFVL